MDDELPFLVEEHQGGCNERVTERLVEMHFRKLSFVCGGLWECFRTRNSILLYPP